MNNKAVWSRNAQLRKWWYWLNTHDVDEKNKHKLTIFPYFRCESGKIDSNLDPDINPKSKCKEFSTTTDGHVILLKPGQGYIWVCKTCYDTIRAR